MGRLPVLIAGALVLAAAYGFVLRASRPAVAPQPLAAHAPAASAAPRMDLRTPPPAPAAALEAPTGVAAGSVAADEVARGAGARAWAESLVARLRVAAARDPETAFLDDAALVLEPWLDDADEPGDPARRAARVQALVARLDDDVLAPRVRGGLLALLGAWGREAVVLARMGPGGVDWRMAAVGLGRASAHGPGGVVLEPRRYLERNPRGGHDLLPFTLARMPDGAWLEALQRRMLVPAESFESLLERELAVLLAGTRLDADARTLGLFTELLFDPGAAQRQIRRALVFALAHAGSDAARATLLAFLEDEQVGEWGKFSARLLVAEQPGGDTELGLLVAPLLDPDSEPDERLTATGLLMKRLDSLSPEAAGSMVELLCARVLDEPDETARLAAVSTLGMAPGGRQRLGALDAVLRRDPSAACRLWAVQGLALSSIDLAGEARALLEAAQAVEPDAHVREAIAAALGG